MRVMTSSIIKKRPNTIYNGNTSIKRHIKLKKKYEQNCYWDKQPPLSNLSQLCVEIFAISGKLQHWKAQQSQCIYNETYEII